MTSAEVASETETAIRSAQDELERAEQLARLDNDPTATTLRALRAALTSIASMIADQRRYATESRLHIDRDFNAVRRARDSLVEIANHAVTAAKAEVEAAHADMARQIVASIAGAAEQRLTAMTRWVWWRTLAMGAALAVVILALGLGLGYWRGHVAGYEQAATSIQASGPVEKAVLTSQGAEALQKWHQLMRNNGIIATMKADCTGKNIAQQNGRTACHLWLWTTPYKRSTAHG